MNPDHNLSALLSPFAIVGFAEDSLVSAKAVQAERRGKACFGSAEAQPALAAEQQQKYAPVVLALGGLASYPF